jgi:hypothetical protein
MLRRHARLSLKAIGLLAQLMSHSPGWNMSIRSLARANGTGVDTIKSAVAELEKHGYLVRSEKQKQNQDGTFADYEWTTADPFQNPVTVKPRHGETAHKEEQDTKEEKVIKNKQENSYEVLFEKFWAEYPRKVDRGAALKAFAKALKHASFEEILTGAIGYANDPNRKPEFTKYPASWLNAQSWLNQVTVSDELPKRTERERERTRAIIAETKEAEAKSAPPPKCPHGDNVALCKKCFR